MVSRERAGPGFRSRRPGALLCLVGLLVLGLASWVRAGAEARPEPERAPQILVLLGDANGAPFSELFSRAFFSEFIGAGGTLRSVRVEYLDLLHVVDRPARERLVALLRMKYANQRFALVVALNPAATGFALGEGAFLAGNAPLIALYPGFPLPERPEGRLGLIGSSFDYGGTLRLALGLRPGAREVLLVTGSSAQDRMYEAQAWEALAPWAGKLAITSTRGLAFPEILARVAEAREGTLVLYSTIFEDGAGSGFVPKEAAAKVVAQTRQPVFGTFEPLLGTGVVGGSMLSVTESAHQIARIALGALRGEAPLPGKEPVVRFPNRPIPLFDWPAFEGHGLDPDRLPRGAVLLRRPPSPWAQYKVQILSIAAIMAVLAGSTLGLAVQNRRRRAAERVAVEQRRWVQVLIDTAPEAIAVYDADLGRYVDVNPAAEALFGCGRGELLQLGPADFFSEPIPGCQDVSESIRKLTDRALAGEVFSYPRDVRSRDGRLIPCQVHLTSLPTQDRRLLRVSYVSLSDLRRAEEELRSSQASLRALFENTADSIWSVDLAYRFRTFNQALVERLRRRFGVEIAPGMGPADFQPADQAAVWIGFYERVLREGAFRQEFMEPNGGGRLELSFNPIRQDGAIVGISVFSKDITEQKRLREQLNQAQKMEAVGQLAGGIAHDFNNALAGIMSAAEVLRGLDVSPAQRLAFADMILVGAERAGALTKKLLAFSRKAETAHVPVDVAAVVNDTAAILGRTLDKRIRVHVDNRAESARVLGDDALLQNAFLNMGINAGHAMPEGGVLTFRLEAVTLDEISCANAPFDLVPGPHLQVSVEDTGCGMPPEVQARIFEPFFTTRRQGEGTGLGLSAVYGTVLDHHGAIQVYSEPGKGTVFHLYLPLATGAGALQVPEPPLERGWGTILLVDDEAFVRLTGKALLERLGYTVLTAEDGTTGLAAFEGRRDEIRLVILDMIMPVMGGRDILRRIRALDPGLPVLICSGFSREGELAQIREEGAFAFLQKPFRQAELAAAVAAALRGGTRTPEA